MPSLLKYNQAYGNSISLNRIRLIKGYLALNMTFPFYIKFYRIKDQFVKFSHIFICITYIFAA